MREAQRAALSLGGNLGDPVDAFVYGLTRLTGEGVRSLAVSSVYRTVPWGRTDQPNFLNMAALVETELSPHDLLTLCLAVEAERGRVRRQRWAPRTLDLDIIDFAGVRLAEAALTLPHPQARARPFVLVPLSEIAPELDLGGASVRSLAAASDASGVALDPAATARLRAGLRAGE
jgi:2-amino-4-hydroxy-6-hydroxymethyldihydropteridine diphosphokinase